MGFRQSVAVPCLLFHTTACPACRAPERCLPSLAHLWVCVGGRMEGLEGAGRMATSAQTAYRQNQLHQLKSQHKGVVLAGIFLASSGSYEVFTAVQDSLSPTQWCYRARFDPSERPMKKKGQWQPWSKTISVINVFSVETNEEEMLFFKLWKEKEQSRFIAELSPGSWAPQQHLEMWIPRRRNALAPEEQDFSHILPCLPIFYHL